MADPLWSGSANMWFDNKVNVPPVHTRHSMKLCRDAVQTFRLGSDGEKQADLFSGRLNPRVKCASRNMTGIWKRK